MLSPTASTAGPRQLSHTWHEQGYSMNTEFQLCSGDQVKIAVQKTGRLKITLLEQGSKTLFGACVPMDAYLEADMKLGENTSTGCPRELACQQEW